MKNKPLPEDLAKRLEEDADLLAAWGKFRPSCQWDYLALIESTPDAARHPGKYRGAEKAPDVSIEESIK